MISFKSYFFIAFILSSVVAYGMQSDTNNSVTNLPELPADIWNLVLNHLIEIRYPREDDRLSDHENEALRHKAACSAIEPFARVCKTFHKIGQEHINQNRDKANEHIEQEGGKYKVFERRIRSSPPLSKLCLDLGVDINAKKYIKGQPFDAQNQGGETLLTKTTKEKGVVSVPQLLKLGVDPCCPNANGEFAIDIAYDLRQDFLVTMIKDAGGDPDNRYKCVNYNVFRVKDTYQNKLKQQQTREPAQKINNSKVPSFSCRPRIIFIVTIVIGAVACWIYNKWKNKEKDKEYQIDKQLSVNTEINCY